MLVKTVVCMQHQLCIVQTSYKLRMVKECRKWPSCLNYNLTWTEEWNFESITRDQTDLGTMTRSCVAYTCEGAWLDHTVSMTRPQFFTSHHLSSHESDERVQCVSQSDGPNRWASQFICDRPWAESCQDDGQELQATAWSLGGMPSKRHKGIALPSMLSGWRLRWVREHEPKGDQTNNCIVHELVGLDGQSGSTGVCTWAVFVVCGARCYAWSKGMWAQWSITGLLWIRDRLVTREQRGVDEEAETLGRSSFTSVRYYGTVT